MRTLRLRRIRPIVVAGAAVLVLAACGGPGAPAGGEKETGGEVPAASSQSLLAEAKKEGKLVWYTSNTRPAAEQIASLFEKRYPEVDVEFFQAGGSQTLSKVESEIVAGGIKADVVDYSQGAAAIDQANRGLLARFAPEHVGEIPDQLVDRDGYFFSPYFLTSSICYNPDVVDERDAPKSWRDLADPKWKGKIGMASPDYAGTAVGTIATWEQEFGEEYLKDLGANGLKVLRGFGDVQNSVLSGQTPIAVNLSFRGIEAESNGEPEKCITPNEGQIRLSSAAAVVADSTHPNAAKLFANFLLGDEVQRAMVEENFFPARPEFGDGVPGFPDLRTARFIEADGKKLADPRYVADVKAMFQDATR